MSPLNDMYVKLMVISVFKCFPHKSFYFISLVLWYTCTYMALIENWKCANMLNNIVHVLDISAASADRNLQVN